MSATPGDPNMYDVISLMEAQQDAVRASESQKYFVSDEKLAREFEVYARDRLLYVRDTRSWHTYDDRRWIVDVGSDRGIRIGRDLVRKLYADASKTDDDARRN